MLYRSWKDVPPDILTSVDILPRKRGKRVGKNRRKYLNVVCAFDIETTALTEDKSVMYIWQLQIGLHDTIIGRSWKEFRNLIRKITRDLPENIYAVCYVHNLSFEFSFLQGKYRFKPEEVFAIDRRVILRCDMYDHIEMRCSYKHSNMRLETYLEKMGVENKKLDYDYTIMRYPWTPLTADEEAYCINDVKGLVQAIYKEMAHDGDTLYTIPATSTGYVRRDVKAAMNTLKYGVIRSILPDLDTYELLREAFRGGDTHANRYRAMEIIENVHNVDMTSAYPAAQLLDKFPVRPFRIAKAFTIEEMDDLRFRRKKALLVRVAFIGLRLRYRFEPNPYLSSSKCRNVRNIALDNGRVLSADYLETTFTDLDLLTIEECYKWDKMDIIYMEYSGYGYLPDVLKMVIMGYFKIKTQQKGLMRDKAKNKLNSIYGMSAQVPVKDSIVYKGPGRYKEEGRSKEELLEENNRKAFFPYQWGVWTTAIVRRRLRIGINEVLKQTEESGSFKDDFLYCDTDSIKYTGQVDFTPINDPIKEAAEMGGYYADDNEGVRHYVGVFEREADYDRFATRGAKKYAYEKGGKITAVIAGVPKREDGGRISGGMIIDKNGGLESFLDDIVIFDNKYKITYNDKIHEVAKVDGKRLCITSCATLSPTDYTLKDTEEYEDLIEVDKKALFHYMRDIMGK